MPDTKDATPSPAKPKPKTNFLSFKLSDEELKKQLDGYKTMKLWQSYRGLSVLLIALSLVLTAALFALGLIPAIQVIVSVVIYGTLAFFIYRGSRVALIIAMVMWTLDKILSISDAATVVAILAWWYVYLKVFYSAYQVETARKKMATKSV